MAQEQKHLPVWFFVGALLLVFGIAVFCSGLYWLAKPSGVILAGLHSDIWWGIIMTAFGLFYVIKHGPWKKGGRERSI